MSQWKDIAGYEGKYQISDAGQVRSLSRNLSGSFNGLRVTREIVLKIRVDPSGYPSVKLYRESIQKTFRIHQLVATHFLGNPDKCINHKDGNKLNNSVDNLEWCSYSHNIQHAYNAGINSQARRVINTKTGRKYNSISDASKAENVNYKLLHYYLSSGSKKSSIKYL